MNTTFSRMTKFKIKPVPNHKRVFAKMLFDATGVELEFKEVNDNDAVTIGAYAEIKTEKGMQPVNGDYVMPDARVFVFVAGILIKIHENEAVFAAYKTRPLACAIAERKPKAKGKTVTGVKKVTGKTLIGYKRTKQAEQEPPRRDAGVRAYLESKKLSNPTATPDNRFAGVLERVQDVLKKQQREKFNKKRR